MPGHITNSAISATATAAGLSTPSIGS